MKKLHSDLPTLINCVTGNPLTAQELYNPRLMVGAFEQMAHEVWRFAPLDPAHSYQKYLPYDYVWHRLSLHLNDPAEIIAHLALTEMIDRVFKDDKSAVIALTVDTKPRT